MSTHAAAKWAASSLAGLGVYLLAACSGGDAGPTNPPPSASVATSVAATSATNVNGVVGQPVTERPTVIVRDQRGNAMAGVAVTFAVQSGGGSVTGASVTTDAAGAASVGSWTLGTAVGANTLAATVGALAAVTFNAAAAAGPAAAMAKVAESDGQTAAVSTLVPVPPAVRITDQFGNPVQGTAVMFDVTGGGGLVTGGAATSNAAGVAAVTSWMLGPDEGPNTLAATAAGLDGSPAVFTAAGTATPIIVVSGVAPALLSPGVTATITGSGFSAVPAQNAVTIAGVAATVTAASTTQLTVAVPSDLPCEPTRNVAVVVNAGGGNGSIQHPLRVATLRDLAAGDALILGNVADTRCNELASNGGRYLISVYNTNRTYSTTGATFELRGAAATAAAPAPLRAGRNTPVLRTADGRDARRATLHRSAEESQADRLHHRILEENLRFAQRHAHLVGRRGRVGFDPLPPALQEVGDTIDIRIPNISAGNFCQNFIAIKARVAYVGTRSIVLDDIGNPLAGQIDTTFAAIGMEFDTLMFDLLRQSYGDPLAMDAQLANSGKVVMVFSNQVNTNMPGLAGFVVTCDFVAPTIAASSNFGQFFYAMVPTVAGGFATAGTPPRWRWTMRATVIHEAKHITSFAERFARAASTFEQAWLEESTARLSEELYERARWGFAQNGNTGYGSAANPVGPYCAVRTVCVAATGQPRGFVRAFEGLALNFFPQSQTRSPIGRINDNDFSFYETGWSLVRWAIDHGTLAEDAFLKGLTQATADAGLANLEARAGRSYADMLPEWLLAMALDDRAGFAPTNPRLRMPSWNLPHLFAGLNADFPANYPNAVPLVTWNVNFGDFLVNGMAVPGTGSFIDLMGTQTATQLIELRAAAGVAAPAELRIAIVRVQ